MITEYALGIDIGGTNIRLAIIDSKYIISHKFMTNNIKKLLKNNNSIVTILTKIIDRYLKTIKLDIKYIGVGIPGLIYNNKILSSPNMIELEEINLREVLENKYNIPVSIEKDVNLIMISEFRKEEKYNNINNAIGFFVGTGFGCSIIINGKLYKGSHGFAGELGHIPLKGKEERCKCGCQGCIEMYAAGRMLESLAKRQNINIHDLFLKENIEDEDIVEFIENVSIAIATAVNILDPDLILIDGGVIRMKGFPIKELKKQIIKRLRSEITIKQLKIYENQTDVFSGCLGAAIYAFENYKERPGILNEN